MIDETENRLSTLTDPETTPTRDETSTEATPADDKRSPSVDVQAYIGRQLRAVYDDVAKQPVPDRFLDLMKQLESVKPGQ